MLTHGGLSLSGKFELVVFITDVLDFRSGMWAQWMDRFLQQWKEKCPKRKPPGGGGPF